ncbi:GMC oxidoreductase [Podospora australis]|uniref:GMC oxidoreductase n=1 Tax=Podospora australis TaxID=1536484 RepID=A0AAN6WZQ8_9PEZI|nr:GMC oxidoreductase [Podospora australis]
MGLLGAFFVSFAVVVNGFHVPHANIKRQVSQLRSSYDFVIVGGGTSGLTVADRLTEAFPSKNVLVVEYGDVKQFTPGTFDPPTTWANPLHPEYAPFFVFFPIPSPDVKNKTGFVGAGQTVGGSSATNGQFFDRGSRYDYDSWAEAAGPGYEAWNWRGLFPYFKKSVTFHPPSAALVQKHGYTWDISAYGGSTPIHASFPPFQWEDREILWNTWKDLGLKPSRECAAGEKEGICFVPTSQHPVTAKRSHAGLAHYADVVASRPNYDLLVRHQGIRVIYPNGLQSGPPTVEVKSLLDSHVFNITATAEVVLAAGSLHTPTILQRSGIGPAGFLQSAGIPVVLDLPGVGSNLHDHSGPFAVTWNYTNPGNFSEIPERMDTDPAYLADSIAGFSENPARGPYTLGLANTAIYVSLPKLAPNHQAIVNRIRQIANDGSASSYLPAEYRTNPDMIRGYKAQLLAIANKLANPKAPSLETPWATGTSLQAFLLHPLSRGTVRLNLNDHLAQPILDYRTGSNPVDFDIHLAHVKFLRQLVNTPTMQQYGAVEVAPGPGVQSDADLVEFIKDQMTVSFQHPSGTAALLPKNKGGVVGPGLKVHDTAGLRVVDMSILSVNIGGHLSSTAYAVGEKAAAIIIEEWTVTGKGKGKAKAKARR